MVGTEAIVAEVMVTADLAKLDDDALAQCAANGDRTALEVLFERHAPMAVSFACTILANRDDALDAAQNGLLQLARELLSDWRCRPFKSCLYTCVHQAALNHHRQSSSRQRREKTVSDHNAKKEEQMCSDPIERDEELHVLREELVALPADTAALLALYHLDGLPIADIAVQTALSIDACKQRLVRGREMLRERLEKRGVVLSGAAMIAALLDTCFASGKALAASGDPSAIARIARHAAAQGIAAAAIGTQILPAGNSGHASAQVRQFAKPGGTLPGRNGTERTLLKGKSLAVIGVLAGIAAIVWICAPDNPSAAVNKESHPIVSQSSVPVASPPAAAPSPVSAPVERPKPVEVTARWQTPRFIGGNFEPISISTRGKQVMLLAADKADKSRRLLLIESRDGGESWNTAATIDGYCNGAAELDGAGGCVLLGMVRWEEPLGADGFPLCSGFTCERIEQRTWTRETGLSSPQIVWKSAEPVVLDNGAVKSEALRIGFCAQWRPKLIAVAGGMWAFALQQTQKGIQFNADTVRCAAAFLPNGAAPRAISFESAGRAENIPAAWARDAQTAGIALAAEDGHKVNHFVTQDGGNTWQASEIPFALPLDSDAAAPEVVAAGLTHEGQHLALLVNSRHWDSKLPAGAKPRSTVKISKSPGGYYTQQDSELGESSHCLLVSIEQTHLLSSPDLGKSWTTAVPPTDCESLKSEHGPTSVLICGSGMTVCHDVYGREITEMKMTMTFHNTSPEVQEMMNESPRPVPMRTGSSIAVRESPDNGQTWRDRHVFDDLGGGVSQVVIGGDSGATHIAAVKELKDHQKFLIIRSFSAVEWKAPENLPAWYKKDDAAKAPQEF